MNIGERLRDYLTDKSIDGREYARIALLVPDLEAAIAEIERLRLENEGMRTVLSWLYRQPTTGYVAAEKIKPFLADEQ